MTGMEVTVYLVIASQVFGHEIRANFYTIFSGKLMHIFIHNFWTTIDIKEI